MKGKPLKTIACEIFRKELEAVHPQLASSASWISAGLHVDLDRLKEAVEAALVGVDHAVCLYGGGCHPDMNDLVKDHAGWCLPGNDCIAAFLEDSERKELEARRALIISPGWLRLWREIFHQGLGWDEADALQNFGFYDSIILLDFGLEPLDDMEILAFFDYTQTPIEIMPAKLDHFKSVINDIIKKSNHK
jgi:hypothetical protein